MNRIRLLRENNNLRQIDVAEATGIDQKTLSNYETGKTNPDSYSLIKLADFFNVSIDYLVGRIDIQISDSDSVIERLSKIQKEIEDIKKYYK